LLTPDLGTLRLSAEERRRLAAACPYFPESYLDFLAGITLHPQEQVKLEFLAAEDGTGEISCHIEGLWRECILYEVPIMAIISEGYFKFVDTDWSAEGQFGASPRRVS
jgi:nicotinate phosphoribosyltransferase